MLTTLTNRALALDIGAEYKFDAATKKLTIKLTSDGDHKVYGDVNIALTGAEEIDIYKKDGALAADYFNSTFKFSRTADDELEYSEIIDRGVEDTAGAFVSLGDPAVKATGQVTITDYSKLVSGTDDAIIIGATTFTAQAGAAVEGEAIFQAATGNNETAASLAAQINAHATAGALVFAEAAAAIITLTAIEAGDAGNAIGLSYTDNDTNEGATVSDTTLENGVDGIEATIDNEFIELPAGKFDFYLLDTEDMDFSTSKVSVKYQNIAGSGVEGVASVFDETGEGDILSINNQTLTFAYPVKVSIKFDDADEAHEETNIPLVING